jgi:PTH1 family peptidyl-tRNA hydrolase
VKLIAGLGNPGERYDQTRHNIGFMILDELARRWNIGVGRARFQAQVGETTVNGEKVILLKPQCFMNRSGLAVSQAMSFYRLVLADLIVVHDDKDLDFARMKIKVGGSDGGHKGIRSIHQSLASPDFTRIRAGVGKPEHHEDTAEFVLNRFYSHHIRHLSDWVGICADAVNAVLSDGPDKAANQYNNRAWVEMPETTA